MAKIRPITKSELLDSLTSRGTIDRAKARELLDGLSALAAEELKRTGRFALPGLIELVVEAPRRVRTGRNPRTGQAIHIPPEVVGFRIAPNFKARLLAGGPEGEPFGPERPGPKPGGPRKKPGSSR